MVRKSIFEMERLRSLTGSYRIVTTTIETASGTNGAWYCLAAWLLDRHLLDCGRPGAVADQIFQPLCRRLDRFSNNNNNRPSACRPDVRRKKQCAIDAYRLPWGQKPNRTQEEASSPSGRVVPKTGSATVSAVGTDVKCRSDDDDTKGGDSLAVPWPRAEQPGPRGRGTALTAGSMALFVSAFGSF